MADASENDDGRLANHGDAASAALNGADGEPVLMKAAVQAVGEAIIITGADCRHPGPTIEYVNPGFTRMTGYAAEEVVGRSPRILQGPRTDRAMLDQLREALAEARTFHGEAVNYRKDGTEYVVEWSITPVMDGDGKVARWIAVQRDVTELKHALARQSRLLAELNHRVNNTLAVVQAVAAQTFRSEPPSNTAFRNRLLALSRLHDLLARRHWEAVSLMHLAHRQLRPFLGNSIDRAEVTGAEFWLRPGAAISLGMALNELGMNAAKHGALSGADGQVHLSWSVAAALGGLQLRLRWSEMGGPALSEPSPHRGFGSRLIERGLAQELHADVRLSFEPSSVRCEIDVPLDAVTGTLL
jgi:PAS domain S-box-containing protein